MNSYLRTSGPTRDPSLAVLGLSALILVLAGSSATGADDRTTESVNDRRVSPPVSAPHPSPSPTSPPSSYRPPSSEGGRGPGGSPSRPSQPGWHPNRDSGGPRHHQAPPNAGDWNRPRPQRPDFDRPHHFPGGRPDNGAGRPPRHHYHPRPTPPLPYYYGPYWSGYYYWYGDYYFWGGNSYSPYRDYFYWDRSPYDDDIGDEETTEKGLYFFPPNPPPLGAPLPMVVGTNSANSAPAELAGFINEPFYAQLGSQLASKALSRPLLDEFEQYRKAKLHEAELLNARLAETAGLDATARKAALEAFAQEQTPRLRALENQAEEFRARLLPKGLSRMFVGSFNWLDRRGWTLASPDIERLSQEEAAAYQFQTMRGFAYYQDGLSPAFRRLLREAALDLQVQAFAGTQNDDEDSDETVVFFSPEMAQVRLTPQMPEKLASRFAVYADERRSLRDELVDALARVDGASAGKRLDAVKRITEALAPKLEALEKEADDIRAEAASQLSVFEPAFAYELPPEIRQRLDSFAADEQALKKRVTDEYAKLLVDAKEGRFSLSIASVGYAGTRSLSIVMVPRLGSSDAKIRARADQIRTFNAESRALARELDERRTSLKKDIAVFFLNNPEASGVATPAEVLEDFEDYNRKALVWSSYGTLLSASFEQGLSLEQRRLLFDTGLEKLKLPLPYSS